MAKPLLQIALDSLSLEKAVADAKNAESAVDIIEVGTILACAEGMKAVSTLRALHPNHIIVCDLKTTDGGAILAKMAFEAGADWLTVSAAAHIATITACKKVADEINASQTLTRPKEIQIEIYGNWTYEDAQDWVNLGIKQAIFHRSRDAELAGKGWTAEDIEKMERLEAIGLEVSITGGIVPEDIHLFKSVKNAKAFIALSPLCASKSINIGQLAITFNLQNIRGYSAFLILNLQSKCKKRSIHNRVSFCSPTKKDSKMNASYRHLTLSERESIMILLAQGKKQSEIARQLGRSCSTISRELKRHALKV